MNDVHDLIELLLKRGVLDDPSLRKGIEQYSVLQRDLHNTRDVTDAPDFQKSFGYSIECAAMRRGGVSFSNLCNSTERLRRAFRKRLGI